MVLTHLWLPVLNMNICVELKQDVILRSQNQEFGAAEETKDYGNFLFLLLILIQSPLTLPK